MQRSEDLKADIEKEIQSNRFFEIDFTEEELTAYREFADSMQASIASIETDVKYVDDIEKIQTQLEDAHRSCMLEVSVPNSASIIRCFLSGTYNYYKGGDFPVSAVKDFLRLLKSVTQEKRRIIIANLHTKLDTVTRYAKPDVDDIPF